jgi:phosphatidylinositol glycan class W
VDYQVKKLLRFCLKYFSFYKILISLVINYMQVHVTEYGVHWNFFFTLAAISILTSFVNIPAKYCGLLGFAVLAGIFQFHFLFFLNYKIVKPNYLQLPWFSGYQTWLLSGLNTYLLSDERGTDIISKNKEGVYSILGYWGMYLLGVHLGYRLFYGKHTNIRSTTSSIARVFLVSLLLWIVTILFDNYVERISRRTVMILTYSSKPFKGTITFEAVFIFYSVTCLTLLGCLRKIFRRWGYLCCLVTYL